MVLLRPGLELTGRQPTGRQCHFNSVFMYLLFLRAYVFSNVFSLSLCVRV